MAILVKSSPHRLTALNMFHKHLEHWCVSVDYKPIKKTDLFNLLYEEGERNQLLGIIQDRLTNEFTLKSEDNSIVHKVTYKQRDIVYDAVRQEEENVKSVIKSLITKEMKRINGGIDMNRLNEILNNVSYNIYLKHEFISNEADKLYQPL